LVSCFTCSSMLLTAGVKEPEPARSQRGTQPCVVGGPHAVDLRLRTHGRPCQAEQCASRLPLPGLGPRGGVTTNSRRIRVDATGTNQNS
jgi:hypothetical protein